MTSNVSYGIVGTSNAFSSSHTIHLFDNRIDNSKMSNRVGVMKMSRCIAFCSCADHRVQTPCYSLCFRKTLFVTRKDGVIGIDLGEVRLVA